MKLKRKPTPKYAQAIEALYASQARARPRV